MSDAEASNQPGTDVVGSSATALTPEAIEAVLADFRAWLTQAPPQPPSAPDNAPDVATIVNLFTGLRQDVNLLTKSVRTLTEAKPNADPDDFGVIRPILKIVADIVDSLERAEDGLVSAVAKVQSQMASPPSWWQRWSTPQVSLEPVDAAIRGLAMSARRAEGALAALGMEPIPTIGRPFDPELMEVVEVISDSELPTGVVVGEVQRGYRWKGQLVRFAKVRAAK